MYSRRLSQFAVAGATIAAGLAPAGPASASATFDPATNTGFVGGADVREAFGWTGAVLVSRAAGLVFGQDFWTDDTYSVGCGQSPFPVVHHRVFGRYELTDKVVRGAGRGHAGYHGGPVGFRLTGAYLGISGTSVPPMVGQPCPAGPGAAEGPLVDRVQLTSSTTGWALTVGSGDVRHRLLVHEAPTP
jgi:hypothetical protein